MSDRMLKINKLIRDQLGQLIMTELEFSLGTLVTITKVDTAADLGSADVYVSVLPEAERSQALKSLIKAAGRLRRALGGKVIIRRTPQLRFFVDDSEEKAAAIDRLLDNLS
jgi:ribosome-binding factor A